MPQTLRYRLDVAPLTPLPLTKSPFFSYYSDTNIAPGALVEISFGQRILKGIVYAGAPLPGRVPLWMKPVRRIIRDPWLTATQLALAQSIAETYFSSLGNTLKHFVFPLAKQAPASLTPRPITKKSAFRRQPKATCVETKDEAELWSHLVKITQAYTRVSKRSTGQLLILVPDLLSLTLLQHTLNQAESDTTLCLSSNLNPKQLELAWNRIRSGQVSIVLGTRQALFAPFLALKEILVLFPEERLSYKQWDMTPYYEGGTVATTLSQLTRAKLAWMSTALGLEQYTHFPKASRQPSGTCMFIDRRLDGKGARSRSWSKTLTQHLEAKQPSSRWMFLAKERGVSGVMLCQSCRTAARCPNCQHVLGEHADGHLRCFNCAYASDFFPKCSHCGAMHFESIGVGTVATERSLERLLPKARILRIDRDTLTTKQIRNEILKLLVKHQYDILVTTPEIGTLFSATQFDRIVLLDSDAGLAFPSFDAEERLLIHVKRLLAKLTPTGSLLIETFSPEERVWQAFSHHHTHALIQELLAERSLLGYPPTTAMIKISLDDTVMTSAAAKQLWWQRLEMMVKTLPGFSLTPLFQGKRERGKIRTRCLLHVPRYTPLPSPLIQWLRRESTHVSIDCDPLSTD